MSARVVLLCGLPGSGKTTYAARFQREGFVRLSLDEVIWDRLGGHDPGRVLSEEGFAAMKEEVRAEQRAQLVLFLAEGRDVVVDYTFWSRAARDGYKALIESCGGSWELHYLPADEATVRQRLAARHDGEVVDGVAVSEDVLADYLDKFEAPSGEGEIVVGLAD